MIRQKDRKINQNVDKASCESNWSPWDVIYVLPGRDMQYLIRSPRIGRMDMKAKRYALSKWRALRLCELIDQTLSRATMALVRG